MKDKIGIAIIGLGSVAKTHVEAIELIKNAKFVAGYHPKIEKAKLFCDKYGAKSYSDINLFLEDKDIDIVAITTPSGAHLDFALKSLKAKKHTIIEKPLEITKKRCDLLISEAKKNDVILSGVFQSRFYEASKLIKKAVLENRFGKISVCDAQVKWFRAQSYYDSGQWRGTWQLDGGGVLMNQAIHAIDLMLWFMGEVDEVIGFNTLRGHKRIEVEDTSTSILKFKNGALGVIEATTSSYPGSQKRIEICGTKGCVILEEENLVKWEFEDEREEDLLIKENFLSKNLKNGGAHDPSNINNLGHKLFYENVIDSIFDKSLLLINGEEASKAVNLIEKIYESGRAKKIISL